MAAPAATFEVAPLDLYQGVGRQPAQALRRSETKGARRIDQSTGNFATDRRALGPVKGPAIPYCVWRP